MITVGTNDDNNYRCRRCHVAIHELSITENVVESTQHNDGDGVKRLIMTIVLSLIIFHFASRIPTMAPGWKNGGVLQILLSTTTHTYTDKAKKHASHHSMALIQCTYTAPKD